VAGSSLVTTSGFGCGSADFTGVAEGALSGTAAGACAFLAVASVPAEADVFCAGAILIGAEVAQLALLARVSLFTFVGTAIVPEEDLAARRMSVLDGVVPLFDAARAAAALLAAASVAAVVA